MSYIEYEISFITIKKGIRSFGNVIYRDNYDDAHELFYDMLYNYEDLFSISIKNTGQDQSSPKLINRYGFRYIENLRDLFKKSLIDLEGM